jgi:GNAT superfamily N-acetyltransferase
VIRSFNNDDRDACADLLNRLPEWFGIAETNAAYIHSLGRLPTAVAELDGQIVGFAAVEFHNYESAELNVIAVSRDRHHHGIGSELLNWAQDYCRDRGAVWFHVKTRGPSTPDPDYEKTRRFYLSRGFAELFETLDLWGPQDAALILVKKLD